MWRMDMYVKEIRGKAEEFFDMLKGERVYPPKELFDPKKETMCHEPTSKKYALKAPGVNVVLSMQERGCLLLLCKRYSIKEIAREMEVSPKTVETYIQRVKEKTGISNRENLRKIMIYCE